MSIEIKLAKHIKKLRKDMGLTQSKFAELSGIDYKHLQSLESIKNPPSTTVGTLVKLSDAFELKLWQFLKPIS